MHKKYIKRALLLLWFTIFGFALYTYISSDTTLSQYADNIRNFIAQAGVWGPLLYIFIYIVRPLVFFPATVLTALSGALFGPFWGIIYTVIGENLSANFSFLVGRYFGRDAFAKLVSKNNFMRKMDCKFRENGFIAVLTMRLTYFPFDLVGYVSGICNLRQREFALGTFFGILPGLMTFVFLGGSFTDPRNLFLAGIFFLIGFGVSRYLKKKKALEKIVDRSGEQKIGM